MLSNKDKRKNLAQKESGLAATLLCVNVSWNWEPRQKHLFIIERFKDGSSRFKQYSHKRDVQTGSNDDNRAPPERPPQVPRAAA